MNPNIATIGGMKCQVLLEEALDRIAITLEAGSGSRAEGRLALGKTRRAWNLCPFEDAQDELGLAIGFLMLLCDGIGAVDCAEHAATHIREALRMIHER